MIILMETIEIVNIWVMNFNQLYYVLALAKEGNYTRAAETLYITQPTLSIQIKELEKELGQKLFIRTRKGIIPTKEGEAFIAFCSQTLSSLEKTLVSFNSDAAKGEIKIGLYWMFGYNGFGEVLESFFSDLPSISPKISVDGSVLLTERVIERDLDVAIITGFYNETDKEFRRLSKMLNFDLVSESEMGILANTKSDLAYKKTIDLKEMEDRPLLLVSKHSNMYRVISDYLKEAEVNPNIIGYSSQADICLQVAYYNIAYSLVTRITYDHSPHHDKVVFIPIVPTLNRQLYIISRKDSEKPVIDIFRRYVLNKLEQS